MKRTKIILSAMCLLVAGFSTTQAQQYKHEISFGAGGGISSLQYKLSQGDHTMGWGGNISLGYTFFLNPHWGLSTGAELAFYNAKATLPQMTSNQNLPIVVNGWGNPSLLTDFNEIEEKQRATYLNIPVMVQYQTATKHKFYVAAGVKFGIPVESHYQSNDGSYSLNIYDNTPGQNAGYGPLYPESGGEVLGFKAYTYKGTENDLPLKLSIMGSVETGVKWQLGDRWGLYTGVFLDYGFNDIYDGDRDDQMVVVDYTSFNENGVMSEAAITENSIIGSSYSDGTNTSTYTDKLSNLACGIKVRVSFGIGRKIAEGQAINEGYSPETKAVIAAADRAAAAADKAAAAADAQKAAADKAIQAAEAQIAAAAAAEKAAQTKQAASNIPVVDKNTLSEVIDNYTTGTYEPLNADQQAIADKKIEVLKKDPNAKVMLVGHTCNLGSKDANYALGLKRAESVKAYMVQKGISADRITAVSKGDTTPKVANDTDEHRKINRRVEVIAYH